MPTYGRRQVCVVLFKVKQAGYAIELPDVAVPPFARPATSLEARRRLDTAAK